MAVVVGGGGRELSGWRRRRCPALEECARAWGSICRGTDVAVALAEGAIAPLLPTVPSPPLPSLPRVKWVRDVE